MISREDIEHLAKLSRIALSEEEKEKLAGELEHILSYVGEIKKAPKQAEGFVVPNHRNIFREDRDPHESGEHTEKLLSAAGDRDREYVRVKKILESGR